MEGSLTSREGTTSQSGNQATLDRGPPPPSQSQRRAGTTSSRSFPPLCTLQIRNTPRLIGCSSARAHRPQTHPAESTTASPAEPREKQQCSGRCCLSACLSPVARPGSSCCSFLPCRTRGGAQLLLRRTNLHHVYSARAWSIAHRPFPALQPTVTGQAEGGWEARRNKISPFPSHQMPA